MLNKQKTFVLGAKSIEMDLIETEILIPNKLNVEFAQIRRVEEYEGYKSNPNHFIQRVLTCQAYLSESDFREDNTYLIDCGGFDLKGTTVKSHDVEPKDFFKGSLIGKIYEILCSSDSDGLQKCDNSSSSDVPIWTIGDLEIPKKHILTIAAENHLIDAYQGRCFGVNPDTLKDFQLNKICKKYDLKKSFVDDKFKKSEEIFDNAKIITLGGQDLKDISGETLRFKNSSQRSFQELLLEQSILTEFALYKGLSYIEIDSRITDGYAFGGIINKKLIKCVKDNFHDFKVQLDMNTFIHKYNL